MNESLLTWEVPDVPEEFWPEVTGERVLTIRAKSSNVTKGGIIVQEETRAFMAYDTPASKVLMLGPEAYKHTSPLTPCTEGPYCQPGDWIIPRLNSGQEFRSNVPGIGWVTFFVCHANEVWVKTKHPEITRTGIGSV